MTVSDLRKILRHLPAKMKIGIEINDIIVSPCSETSGVELITDFELHEEEQVLLLSPCKHCSYTEELFVHEDELNLN